MARKNQRSTSCTELGFIVGVKLYFDIMRLPHRSALFVEKQRLNFDVGDKGINSCI